MEAKTFNYIWCGLFIIVAGCYWIFTVGGCIDRATQKPTLTLYQKLDSPIVIKRDTAVPNNRYFLIQYQTRRKGSGEAAFEGNISWISSSFPSKADIEKSIWDDKDMYWSKKDCQKLLITNIIEFKDSSDYYNFYK